MSRPSGNFLSRGERQFVKGLLATREYLKEEEKLAKEAMGKVEALFKGE